MLFTKRVSKTANSPKTGYNGGVSNGKLYFDTSKIWRENVCAINTDSRIIINRGGTRSTKTISLLQLWLALAFQDKYDIYICRATFPSLRLTVLKDFRDLLTAYGIAHHFKEHKTEHTFTHLKTGTVIYFIAFDVPQKARGVSADFIHLEEGNEIPFETYRQLLLRLKEWGKLVISFNPSDENVWINTEIEQKRADYTLIKSSYKDNPFLLPTQIKEIENLKTQDQNFWHIFGLGEYGSIAHKVYPTYQRIDFEQFARIGGESAVGIDFGYNDPTAVCWVKYKDGNLYVHELLYRSYLDDPIPVIAAELKQNRLTNAWVYCEHEPAFENRLRKMLNSNYVFKAAKSDLIGSIRFVRSLNIHITNTSVNLLREIGKYSNKTDLNGRVLEDPIRFDDHALDAMRYAAYTHLKDRILRIK